MKARGEDGVGRSKRAAARPLVGGAPLFDPERLEISLVPAPTGGPFVLDEQLGTPVEGEGVRADDNITQRYES